MASTSQSGYCDKTRSHFDDLSDMGTQSADMGEMIREVSKLSRKDKKKNKKDSKDKNKKKDKELKGILKNGRKSKNAFKNIENFVKRKTCVKMPEQISNDQPEASSSNDAQGPENDMQNDFWQSLLGFIPQPSTFRPSVTNDDTFTSSRTISNAFRDLEKFIWRCVYLPESKKK